MMFGYDAGVLAGVQATEPFLHAIGHPERRSTIVIPMVASAYTLGAWVMSMVVSFIGSPMGRRNCLLYGNILGLAFIYQSLINGSANEHNQLPSDWSMF